MAVSVTAEISRLLKAKEQKLLDGTLAIKGLLSEVQKQILAELAAVSGDSYTAMNLRQNLASIERYLQGFESSAQGELGKLIDDAWQLGGDLPFEAARAGGLLATGFGHIPGTVLETLKDLSTYRISGLSGAAFDKIRGELSLGILGQKTPHQVTQAIAGTLQSPGVFRSIAERAEIITGVEMGRAYSQATELGMAQAQSSVPALKKQWWHAGHPKQPRQNHLKLHGQVQPIGQKFLLGSLAMMFPRDPAAPASEVIRCGCDHVPYLEVWAERDKGFPKLPIYNERGEVIALRGPRTGREEPLTGKFELGQIKR